MWDENQTNIMKVDFFLGICCNLFLKRLQTPLLLEFHHARAKLIAHKQNTQVRKSLVMQGIIFLSLWYFMYFTGQCEEHNLHRFLPESSTAAPLLVPRLVHKAQHVSVPNGNKFVYFQSTYDPQSNCVCLPVVCQSEWQTACRG